jgi:hypothetical protein
MNPWAGVLVLLSIAFFIVAYKGTQDNVIAAVKGQPYGNSNIEGVATKPLPQSQWNQILQELGSV